MVRDVTCVCPRGAVTALVGPNGAGKSTLLKAILGLVPSRGSVLLDGIELLKVPPRERAKLVAYVPQRSRLDARMQARSVVEQGRFAHRGPLAGLGPADHRAVDEALAVTGAHAHASRVFTELSLGEQQRIILARALATGARALLLDEPTSALDARQALLLHQALRRLADRGWCIVVVLHNLDEVARHSDFAMLMNHGAVFAHGPTPDIIDREPVHSVYGVELRKNAGLGLFLPKEISR